MRLSVLFAVSATLLFAQAHPRPYSGDDAYNTERDIDLSEFAQSIQGAMEQRGTWDYMKRDLPFEGQERDLTLEELVERTEQAGLVERNTLMSAEQALPMLVALDPATGATYKSYDLASEDEATPQGEDEGGTGGVLLASASVDTAPRTTNFALSSLPSTVIPPYYSPGGKGGALNEVDTATTSGAATRGARVPLGTSSGVGAAAVVVLGAIGGLVLAMV